MGDTLYRSSGSGLFRSAVSPLGTTNDCCPDPTNIGACRTWLRRTWSDEKLAAGVRIASPTLADRLDDFMVGAELSDKQLRGAVLSLERYRLRATGRHTPFGLFAGVAPLAVGEMASIDLGDEHRPEARVDSAWLADVIDRLEACPVLLERLDVCFNDLCVERDSRLEVPRGPSKATVRATGPVRLLRELAKSPVRVAWLLDRLSEGFPGASAIQINTVLSQLVKEGFLITCFRAPLTETDPFRHLLDRLTQANAATTPVVALAAELNQIHADLAKHNASRSGADDRGAVRASIVHRARALSGAGRSILAVDLRLDRSVQIPAGVANELEQAATTLIRLSRQPRGQQNWREYHVAFCERFGIGTLVPLAEVIDPAAGLGFPHGYAGSMMRDPASEPVERDARLLELAWQAFADGTRVVVLTDETVQSLAAVDDLDTLPIPPHVEMAARIHAASLEAIDHGDYRLVVSPARAAGTLTSRFSRIVPEAGLNEHYADLPSSVEGALQAQLSFPPAYPHAENVCRVPAYLPAALSLGEHRASDENVITMEDLAITATRNGFHLVTLAARQIVEPQVFHALALEKQPAPVARFVAQISRSMNVAWHEFDWGPFADNLPFLPRVTYGKVTLASARWKLRAGDLPAGVPGPKWRRQLTAWSEVWGCPAQVELTDADRSLRLDLTLASHCVLLHAHLRRNDMATLTELASARDFGWIDGYAHDVILPLSTTRAPQPPVPIWRSPKVSTRSDGQFPGADDSDWLFAKIYTHPDLMDSIITSHLPELLKRIGGDPGHWFIRYRSQHEPDHLRLRLSTLRHDAESLIPPLAGWVDGLRAEGLMSRLVFDTYYPEVGRYGDRNVIDAAEDAFVADSLAVGDQLLELSDLQRDVLTAVNMVGIVEAFLGSRHDAMTWLQQRAIQSDTRLGQRRAAAGKVANLIRTAPPVGLPLWLHPVADTWHRRAEALALYRKLLPMGSPDVVLESLLHMHHNRISGIDPEHEKACRLLTRRAAMAWLSTHDQVTS